MTPFYCLWAESYNRTRDQLDQFEYERVINLNLAGALISFFHMHSAACWRGWRFQLVGEGGGREGVRLKLDVQGQGGGEIPDVDEQGRWEVLIIRQFSRTSYVYPPF